MQSKIIKPKEVMEALMSGSNVLCIEPEYILKVSKEKQNIFCISLKDQTIGNIENLISDNNPDKIIFVKIDKDITEKDENEKGDPNYAE